MPETNNLSKVQSAAVLLMSLGEEYAAEILKHMAPRALHKIGAAMADVSNVDRDQVSEVLGEFNQQVDNQTSMGVASENYIRSVMVRALGRDKAKRVIDGIFNMATPSGVDALKWMDSKAIAAGLRDEHPQVVALVLSGLETPQAAEVVALLPEALRYDALLRVATLDGVSSTAISELNDVVEKQIMANISAAATSQIGGRKRAAEILNQLDSDVEGPILDRFKEIDEELGQDIEGMMLMFDSLLAVDDRGIQTLLREIASDILMVALRGADEAMKEKILHNMSRRAAEMLRGDLEIMPPVRLSDVEVAQREIMTVAKRLADEGQIALGSKGGDQLV